MEMLPHEICTILEKLGQNRFKAYLVGGAVRDMLMGRIAQDFDLVTDARPEDIIRLFPRHYPLGARYGTIVVHAGAYEVEVSSFRDIDLAGDLARRDFTINAMAWDLGGTVYDFYGGQKDLASGLIRSVGCAEARIKEDYMRMLRAVRLSLQLDFNLDRFLYKCIKVFSADIRHCSPERIRDELNLMLLLPEPSRAFRLLHQLRLLPHILPELEDCYGFEQHSRHHHLTVFDHTMLALDNSPPRLATRLGALFHDIAKPACFTMDENQAGHFYDHHRLGIEMTEAALQRLRYDYKTIQKVKLLVECHMSRFEALGESGAKRLIRRVGEENLEDLFDLQAADIRASLRSDDFSHLDQLQANIDRILAAGEPFCLRDLAIKGSDLLELGWESGPHIGLLLEELLQMVIEQPALNQREILLELVNQRWPRPESAPISRPSGDNPSPA